MSQHEVWTEEIKSEYSLFDLNLKEVWRYRDLVYLLVKRDFVTSFKQTVLGPLWFFIQPILTTLTYVIIFGNVAKLSTDGAPMFLFYLAGATLWNYFSTSLSATATVFQANAGIFGKVYFPRLVMPLSIVISNLMRTGVQFILFLFVLFYYIYKGETHPNAWVLATPLLIIIMAFLALGLGMILSSITTKYRDFSILISFGIQLFMYATPVIYPISQMPEWARGYAMLNPLTGIFECFKYGYLGVGDFSPIMLVYSAVISFIILAIGIVTFNKVQRSFMDTV